MVGLNRALVSDPAAPFGGSSTAASAAKAATTGCSSISRASTSPWSGSSPPAATSKKKGSGGWNKRTLARVLRRGPRRSLVRSSSRSGVASVALEQLVANVVDHIGQIGYETGYVLGNLHQLSNEATAQASIYEGLSAATEQIKAQNRAVVDAAHTVLAHAVQIRDRSADCQVRFEDSAPALREVSGWLMTISGRLDTITAQLGQVGDAASKIGRIATQTHVLALNASIEATKASSDGRGFAVIADSVRALASESAASAVSINATLNALRPPSTCSGPTVRAPTPTPARCRRAPTSCPSSSANSRGVQPRSRRRRRRSNAQRRRVKTAQLSSSTPSPG